MHAGEAGLSKREGDIRTPQATQGMGFPLETRMNAPESEGTTGRHTRMQFLEFHCLCFDAKRLGTTQQG